MNVQYIDSVVDLSNRNIVSRSIRNITIKGENSIKSGETVIVNNPELDRFEAYYVLSSKIDKGNTVIEYRDASLKEIYKTIDIYQDFVMTSENITIFEGDQNIAIGEKLLSTHIENLVSSTVSKDVSVRAKVELIPNGARVQESEGGEGVVFSFIDKSGKAVIKDLYNGWVPPTNFYEGLFAFAVMPNTGNAKWAYFDRNNKQVFSTGLDVSYDYSSTSLLAEEVAGIFSNGLAWFKSKNLVGYLNKEGNKITALRFSSLSENEFIVAGFSKDGFALVREGSVYSILTRSGNILNNQEYDGIQIVDKEQ